MVEVVSEVEQDEQEELLDEVEADVWVLNLE